jgi:hypothetical protein
MGGSSTINQSGVYPTSPGTPGAGYIPGGRSEASTWVDSSGNFWLFGGGGLDANGKNGDLNDLWEYSFPVAATPVFSEPSDTYTSALTVTISDTTPNEVIYYTTDGTTPITSSNVYSGAVTVSSTETLEAIATASGYSASAVATAVYTITSAPTAATPTFSPVAGTYSSTQIVTISDTTSGAAILYTTDGTTPSYTGNGLSPIPGPSTTRYSGPITVSSTETIEAIATAFGDSASTVATALYTINVGAAQVTDNETITVTDTETFPDVADSEQITVTDTEIVRAYTPIVITPSAASFNASSGTGYATHAYAPVTFTATGGASALTLTETGTLPSGLTFSSGVLGGTPATSSAGSSYPFSVTATDTYGDSATLQGYSLTIQPASAFPAVVTDDETITVTDTESFPDVADAEQITVTDTVTVSALPLAATPDFSVAAGTYTSAQTVSISDSTPNATIYYAINGTPTLSSSVYSSGSPITVSSTETLEAIATATGFSTSEVAIADYTINNPAPVIDSISPAFIDAGGAAFTLTVNGSGFIASSKVYWGTSALTTTYVSATQLTAQVTAADIATAGTTAAITVQTPTPGGGTSNALQFEVDSSSGTTTGPVFTSTTATVTAGSPASYPVTLPSGVTSVTVTCLNLPPGATCSYSATTKTVTITTSSTTPKGTYQITVVFTETVSGAGTAGILLPILLLPLVLLRRKLAARGIWANAFLGLVLMAGAAAVYIGIGCGGSSPHHQVTSSGVVSLTVQ